MRRFLTLSELAGSDSPATGWRSLDSDGLCYDDTVVVRVEARDVGRAVGGQMFPPAENRTR